MIEITGRYTNVQGCRTYFESVGQGSPVLFLAPAGRDTVHWHRFLTEIGRKHRAIAVDLPGRGKSFPYPTTSYLSTADSVVEFIRAFLDATGVEEVAIVGCSLGGNLAYACAATFPERVKAVVALEGTDYSPAVSADTLEILEHPAVSHVEFLTDNVLSLTGSAAPKFVRTYLVDSLPNVNARALRADLACYRTTDIRDRMGAIRADVLSVRGTEDWLVSEGQIHATLSRLTNARSVEHRDLDGVGHWPHLEAADATIALVELFLDRVYR